jgi:ABC-type sulfate/molybdate transport systems ATPase subunit
MYISKIVLENVRCFERIEVDLKSGASAKKWLVVLGDNGVGKTTLLRCIAMGLCDRTSAGALLRDTNGETIRKGEEDGTIKITLDDRGQS